MQFSQYIWDLYKQSEEGEKAISFFSYDNVFWNDVNVIRKHHPFLKEIINKREYECEMKLFGEMAYTYKGEPRKFDFNEFSDVRKMFEEYLEEGVYDGYDNEKTYLIEPKDYKLFLEYHVIMSFYFFAIAYDFTFPNLFIYRFFDLNKIADTFNIELPPIPKKSDYKARCMYYIDLCEVFHNFRIENDLSPNELCAFLYDFAPNFVEKGIDEIPNPTQAWFIGGIKGEFDLENAFWQSNPETKKGDILVHYETSPISAITHIWQAKTDGIKDPFFYYYANSYLTNGIEIPKITLKELKEDMHFQHHPLVRKNFQGINGWAMTNEDYNQFLRILQSKGFNTKTLPIPYVPDAPKGIEIKTERDVEEKLLEFYLKKIGLTETKDYVRQLPIKAGRGCRVYPDYALYYDNTKGYEKAKILIEAKLNMKNNKETEDCFKQARSYANILESSLIVLCDKKKLLFYKKKNSFDRNNYKKIYWEELKNPDTYNVFKKYLLT